MPELISYKFDNQKPNLAGKPRPKPIGYGKTKVARSHFRFQAYRIYKNLPDWLTKIKNPKRLKKLHKKYAKNLLDIPENKKIK